MQLCTGVDRAVLHGEYRRMHVVRIKSNVFIVVVNFFLKIKVVSVCVGVGWYWRKRKDGSII